MRQSNAARIFAAALCPLALPVAKLQRLKTGCATSALFYCIALLRYSGAIMLEIQCYFIPN
ncbi:MAG: hypothetical protein ACKO4X_10500, partial [Alphaproteobacteria bacterium]